MNATNDIVQEDNKYAVIKSGGKQYYAKEGKYLVIDCNKKQHEINKVIEFNEILLLKQGTSTQIGKPNLPNVSIKAEIVKIFRDKKIKILKFKRRKNYLRCQGHRQDKIKVLVKEICVSKEKSNGS